MSRRPTPGADEALDAAPVPPFPTLETPRLWLREISAADALALFAIHGDAERMRWFGVDPLPDLAAASALVGTFASWRRAALPGTRWGLQPKQGGELIGTCGLFAWHATWRKCVVGYELARGAEGQGYMHEALSAALDHAFGTTALHRVEAQVHPQNTPSIRVLERLGFRLEGRQREAGHWGGRHHDMLMYGLLRTDRAGEGEVPA